MNEVGGGVGEFAGMRGAKTEKRKKEKQGERCKKIDEHTRVTNNDELECFMCAAHSSRGQSRHR